jgi:hypothetical protein
MSLRPPRTRRTGSAQVAGERLEDVGSIPRRGPSTAHRPRIPVPSVARRRRRVAGCGRDRWCRPAEDGAEVVRHGVGRLVDAGETLRIAVHEGADASDPVGIGAVGDVDEHQTRPGGLLATACSSALRPQAGHPASDAADDRRSVELRAPPLDIGHVSGQRVVARRVPADSPWPRRSAVTA